VGLGGSVPSGGLSGAGASNGGANSRGGTGGSNGVETGGTGGIAGASAGSAGAAGAAGSSGSNAGGATGFPFVPSYIIGADITWTLEQEARGSTYSDAGKVQPLEQIMANNGFNYIRIRTFVNPSAPGGYSSAGFADIAHTVTWAKRVKACGMGILLDFHMSDTWASIGVQKVPSAWAGMSPSDMQKAAHDYVKAAMAQMVAAGVKPDMVQIGNETNSAMSGVSMSNWANFSGLVNAGIKAVRETDPKIIVIAQHGRPRPDGMFEPWVDRYLAGSPPIDVDGICGSTYGTTNNGADWTQEFGYVINKYDKPVWSCEYTDDHRALINGVMRALPKGMGRGTFIWEPTQYGQPLFTNSGGKFVTNARMAEYPKMAKSYNLPVPSGTCH
jgi:arabinogalactan endo-1,4-beta-galactosidase